MNVIVVGLGVQGQKRKAVSGTDLVATVDPVHPDAKYKTIRDVPLDLYDAALLCIPDQPKIEIIDYLLQHRKHVLVEKPLFAEDRRDLIRIQETIEKTNTVCYTAYNHRFEPHFVRMKRLLESGRLGKIYSIRLFYGNGTARLVRDSAWRDTGMGVLPDLGSHLLDTILFWLEIPPTDLRIQSANCFENRSPDHVTFSANSETLLQFEVSLLSWRNYFSADVFAENGSAHISSLCKWGPTTFRVHERKFPSGRPDEESITLVQPDPTWALEYEYFCELCRTGGSNIRSDVFIHDAIQNLSEQLRHGFGGRKF